MEMEISLRRDGRGCDAPSRHTHGWRAKAGGSGFLSFFSFLFPCLLSGEGLRSAGSSGVRPELAEHGPVVSIAMTEAATYRVRALLLASCLELAASGTAVT